VFDFATGFLFRLVRCRAAAGGGVAGRLSLRPGRLATWSLPCWRLVVVSLGG
jgi:hypothetical protein